MPRYITILWSLCKGSTVLLGPQMLAFLDLGRWLFLVFLTTTFPLAISSRSAAQDDIKVEVVTQLGDPVGASATLSPDGRTVLSQGSDNAPKLWDPSTGRLIRVFQGYSAPSLLAAEAY